MEKYPRGSRGSPAKGVVCVKRSAGSNPAFSAIKIAPFWVLFLWHKTLGNDPLGSAVI